MKLNNYILLFFIVGIAFYIPIHHYGATVIEVEKEQLQYNRKLENAVDDSLFQLVEKDSSKEVVLNKEKVAEHFYQSLCSNFGLLTNSLQQERLKQCVPLLLLTDKDGFYVNVTTIKKDKNGNDKIEKVWSKKERYSYSDETFSYEFTLGNEIKLYNKKGKLLLEGDYYNFAGKYPNNKILNEPDVFEKTRRMCIINHLKNAMEKSLKKHNAVATSLGISYQFFFPTIEKEDWYRTIDNISLLVIFQGYPLASGKGDFNRYAIGGARIWKHSLYYTSFGEDKTFYYHKENCSKRGKKELIYTTKKECALNGANPCPICRP